MPFNSIFAWILKKRIHQIDLFRKYPLEVQKETLEKLVQKSVKTVWGIQNNFSNIHDYNAYRLSVPLQEYEDVKPWIDRLLSGEQNVLWPTETKNAPGGASFLGTWRRGWDSNSQSNQFHSSFQLTWATVKIRGSSADASMPCKRFQNMDGSAFVRQVR